MVSIYSRACRSVASFTGSWWPCARTCRGNAGQGQAASLSSWTRLGRAGGISPASPEVSGPGPRPLPRTCPSSRSRCSAMKTWGTHHQGPPPTPALPTPAPAAPYSLTNGLQVQGLQFMGHLSAPLPVPAIKVGGLEKPPVGNERQWLWGWPCVPWVGHRHPVPTGSRRLRFPIGIYPPIEAQPVALEDAGELGPSMFQAAQEVILVEGPDLGRGLRQGPGEPWCLSRDSPTGPPPGHIPGTFLGPHPAWDRSQIGGS